MAPKRPSPLDEPPAASSSEEEEEASSEEEASGSGSESESESEEPEPPKTTTLSPTPAAEKKPPPKKPDSAVVSSKAQSSSSGSESESESGSDLEVTAKRRANVAAAAANVKPISSKPMEETPPPPKTKKPRSKSSATATPSAARAGSKRPSEIEPKDSSKRPKKKGPDQEADDAEEEPKKAGAGGDDSKKLFQRIWSDEDEITILKGMIDYTAKKGVDPYTDMAAFHDLIKKSLKADVNKTQLQDKVRRLKKKYEVNVAKGKKYNPVKPHEVKVFELSKKVWGGGGGGGGGGGEGSSGGGFELSKCNGGKTKNNQKGNSKTLTLASLKAELLGSPEPQKEAEKAKIGNMPVASESSSEVIGFDKGFRELGLPETVVKQGLELIGGSKRAELKDKWNDLHVAELEIFVKRTELMRDQAKMILEAFKSSNH